jgi:hypothetical protein
MGLFTGLGTARIDEYVTSNALSIEYDGLVNLTGIAVIAAVDKLTAGLTFGEITCSIGTRAFGSTTAKSGLG